MKKIAFSLIVGALFLGNSSQLHAQIINGSFTTGDFTGWNTVGGTSGGPQVLTTSATLPTGVTPPTPPTGSTQALIQSTDGDDTGATSATVAAIETAFNAADAVNTTYNALILPSTYNDNPSLYYPYTSGPFVPDNGQAIYQTFTLSSEATLTFAYSYQTFDGYPFDSAGYVLDGNYSPLAPPSATPAGTTPPYPSSDTPNLVPTAYVFVSPITLSAGTHTLGFVAYNTQGPADSTSLYVTDISVPEPGEWALMLLGAVGLIFARKFRARFSAI